VGVPGAKAVGLGSLVLELSNGERLSRLEDTLEARMLEEVPQQEVPAAAGHPLDPLFDVSRGHFRWEIPVAALERFEGVEHFSMAARGSLAPCDDVPTIGPASAS